MIDIKITKTQKSRLPEMDWDNVVFGKTFSDHMLVADYEDGKWTCEIKPYANLNISPALSTLHYGQTIFEGMKAYKNSEGKVQLFRSEDNFDRLQLSAERMCMPSVPKEIFLDGLKKLLDLDRGWVPSKSGYSLYIRPFLFASDEYIGLRPSKKYKFIIFSCPVGAYYSEPVNVKIETEFTRAFPGGIGAAKTAGNYAASLYPADLNHKKGFDQLIWTDGLEHKYIEEAGTMNIVFRMGNKVFAPKPGETVLDGITRRSVMQLAKDWGYEVAERKVTVEEIIDALKNNTLDEAFGAGTAATIAHIKSIHFDGVDYVLPEVATRTFSNKVLTVLDDIKYGRAEDPHHWIVKI